MFIPICIVVIIMISLFEFGAIYLALYELKVPLIAALQLLFVPGILQLIAVCALDYCLSKKKNREFAIQNGKPLQAQILAFEYNWDYTVNGNPELCLILRLSPREGSDESIFKMYTGKFSTSNYCIGGEVTVYEYNKYYYLPN